MLPKCWRHVNGEINLYAGGTSGASNTGKEPYFNFYAAQVVQVLGVDASPTICHNGRENPNVVKSEKAKKAPVLP